MNQNVRLPLQNKMSSIVHDNDQNGQTNDCTSNTSKQTKRCAWLVIFVWFYEQWTNIIEKHVPCLATLENCKPTCNAKHKEAKICQNNLNYVIKTYDLWSMMEYRYLVAYCVQLSDDFLHQYSVDCWYLSVQWKIVIFKVRLIDITCCYIAILIYVWWTVCNKT